MPGPFAGALCLYLLGLCSADAASAASAASGAKASRRGFLQDARPRWSYDQYATVVAWGLHQADVTTYEFTRKSGVAAGSNITGIRDNWPPYYIIQASAEGSPYWQYPLYRYHHGFIFGERRTCHAGDWQDKAVTYDDGPEFLRRFPVESWTLCKVAADGGLGGGWYWYLFFANITRD